MTDYADTSGDIEGVITTARALLDVATTGYLSGALVGAGYAYCGGSEKIAKFVNREILGPHGMVATLHPDRNFVYTIHLLKRAAAA